MTEDNQILQYCLTQIDTNSLYELMDICVGTSFNGDHYDEMLRHCLECEAVMRGYGKEFEILCEWYGSQEAFADDEEVADFQQWEQARAYIFEKPDQMGGSCQ